MVPELYTLFMDSLAAKGIYEAFGWIKVWLGHKNRARIPNRRARRIRRVPLPPCPPDPPCAPSRRARRNRRAHHVRRARRNRHVHRIHLNHRVHHVRRAPQNLNANRAGRRITAGLAIPVIHARQGMNTMIAGTCQQMPVMRQGNSRGMRTGHGKTHAAMVMKNDIVAVCVNKIGEA